eukprot:403342248
MTMISSGLLDEFLKNQIRTLTSVRFLFAEMVPDVQKRRFHNENVSELQIIKQCYQIKRPFQQQMIETFSQYFQSILAVLFFKEDALGFLNRITLDQQQYHFL